MTFRPSIIIKLSSVTRMAINGLLLTRRWARTRSGLCLGWQPLVWCCLWWSISNTLQTGAASNGISSVDQVPEPSFIGPIENTTVPVGKEATLSCYVNNLGSYKVGWIRLVDQTVLALHNRVVTHNARYAVLHEESHTWQLKIRQIRDSDRGCYMCQINTNPMKKQFGCIDVFVPPDISDEESTGDVVAVEGDPASLFCSALGHPEPRIIWRRENASPLLIRQAHTNVMEKVDSHQGSFLNFSRVDRRQMGAYLCIASNDVPPAVSKRVFLNVHFAPESSTSTAVLNALQGSDVTVQCNVSAYPVNVNYWIKGDSRNSPLNQIESNGGRQKVLNDPRKYSLWEEKVSLYEIRMRLTIRNFTNTDLGTYKCVSTNTMGRANSTVRISEMRIPTTTTTTTPSTTTTTTTTRRPATVRSTGRPHLTTKPTRFYSFVGISDDFNMDALTAEYPTFVPVHENPYVVSNAGGGAGVGYVESNQPFHDNIYSTSDRLSITLFAILTEIAVISLLNCSRMLQLCHIR